MNFARLMIMARCSQGSLQVKREHPSLPAIFGAGANMDERLRAAHVQFVKHCKLHKISHLGYTVVCFVALYCKYTVRASFKLRKQRASLFSAPCLQDVVGAFMCRPSMSVSCAQETYALCWIEELSQSCSKTLQCCSG